MAIASIVTGGYGNGTLSGVISKIVTAGYISSGAVISTSLQTKDIESFGLNSVNDSDVGLPLVASTSAGLPSIGTGKISTGVVTR